ncbi:MAG: glycosyltransferase family 2 protein [Candidatus Buchananbacteria bacterium]
MIKKVAVILLTHGTYAQRFLDDCRDSLRKQTYPESLFKIVLIDNGTPVEEEQRLRQALPEAVYLRQSENTGFARGNNQGFRWAQANGYDYAVALNMDTIINPTWLAELVQAAESDERIGAVQPKILLWPSKKINSLGNVLHFLGFGYCWGYGQEDNFTDFKIRDVLYVSGCSAFYRLKALEQVGLFDEDLFFYHEDTDLSWRLRLLGWRTVIAPASKLYHKYEFSRSVKSAYFNERNRWIIMLKNYHWLTWLLIWPALVVMEVGILGYSLVSGNFLVKLKVYRYFLSFKNWRNIFKARRQVQTTRIVKEREITKNFVGKIEFQEINNPVLKYLVNPVFNLYWQVVKRLIIW